MEALGVKFYELIVENFIRNSRIKEIERIPPGKNKRTAEIEKNSINTYIVIINMIRLQGHHEFWYCIFGKTLGLLKELWRGRDAPSTVTQLELIKNGYINLNG